MQFVSEILNFQSLLVMAAIFVSGSNALLCTTCLTSGNCTYAPQTQECTVVLVTQHHNLLSTVNPNLVVPPSNASVFKCYDLDMSYVSPLTGSTVLVVQKGCTYNSTNFCEGWDNTTTVNRCTTCASDDCNRGQTEGTTTSVATTTPLNNSTTTVASTTDVSNTTTSASLTTTTEASTTTSAPANSTTTSASVTATTTTAATTTTSAPASSTTTSATTTVPVTTTRPSTSTVTTTTAKAGGVTNLGCLVNWFTIAGYALLHGLIARW